MERAKSRFLRYTCNGKQRTLEFDEERALMAETQKATVVFGVLNETSQDETRVALTPDIVTRLKKAGVSCLVQSGAGIAAQYTDDEIGRASCRERV